MESDGGGGEGPADYARAFARLENHYFVNKGFLEVDGQILRDLHRIAQIPGTIVQGRYDMICTPLSAFRLVSGWPSGRLHMIKAAGHALSEPGISQELVRVMGQVGEKRVKFGLLAGRAFESPSPRRGSRVKRLARRFHVPWRGHAPPTTAHQSPG